MERRIVVSNAAWMAVAVIAVVTPGAARAQTCGSFGFPPKEPECNVARCTGDGWVPWPVAAGTPCNGGVCDGGVIAPGLIEPEQIGMCRPSTKGSIFPKWSVLTVYYSPPGTKTADAAPSSIEYSAGSTFGTTTNTSTSYKNSVSYKDESKVGFLGTDGTFSWTIGNDWGTTDTTETDVSGSVDNTWQVAGPNSLDGVDHGFDTVLIWLNPQVDVTVDYFGNVSHTLKFKSTDPTLDVVPVLVRHLLDPVLMRAENFSTYDYLVNQKGVPESEFMEMASADPFFTGTRIIDPNRFTWLSVYDFESGPCGNPTWSGGGTWSQSTTYSTTHESDISVSATMELSGGFDFLSFIANNFTFSDKFTWEYTNSTKVSNGTNKSISVKWGQPSCSYNGPIKVNVYVDNVFHTYMFNITNVINGYAVVSLTPSSPRVVPGGTVQLNATVATNSTTTGVSWSVSELSGGTVSSAGLYRAPNAPGTYHVVAQSIYDRSSTATSTITVACDPGYAFDGVKCVFVCTPTSCAAAGKTCGTIPDGCGGTLSCGTCQSGYACTTSNICACVPTTCAFQGKNCGTISDGCGGSLSCGTCSTGYACNASNVCACVPTTCAAQGKNCGTIADGCGGTLSCGTCRSGYACNASNVCACVPLRCNGRVGTVSDGCGGTIYCPPPNCPTGTRDCNGDGSLCLKLCP